MTGETDVLGRVRAAVGAPPWAWRIAAYEILSHPWDGTFTTADRLLAEAGEDAAVEYLVGTFGAAAGRAAFFVPASLADVLDAWDTK